MALLYHFGKECQEAFQAIKLLKTVTEGIQPEKQNQHSEGSRLNHFLCLHC